MSTMLLKTNKRETSMLNTKTELPTSKKLMRNGRRENGSVINLLIVLVRYNASKRLPD